MIMSKLSCNALTKGPKFLLADDTDFQCKQTVLSLRKNLPILPNYQKPKEEKSYSLDNQWYPHCNSYYNYTEDVDAFARVHHLLNRKPSILSLNLSEADDLSHLGTYTERDAQLRYLSTNPVSFLIMGKPEIGQESLGRKLSDYWGCVYLDPEVLIEDEIVSGSRAGQCIEFNLRCGRAIGIDVILRLLEKRVKTQTIEHRGFVLVGLPVIPNELYREDPVSSEAAIFTVKDIFDDLLEATIEIGVAPSKPHVSISSKVKVKDMEDLEGEEMMEVVGEEATIKASSVRTDYSDDATVMLNREKMDLGSVSYSICNEPEIGTNFEEQLNFIFNLFQEPFMFVYITCPMADVIMKRSRYRYSVRSHENLDLLKDKIDQQNPLIEQLVLLPRHFPVNVQSQLDNYRSIAASAIDRRVLLHNPQYYLRLDGRVFPSKMYQIVLAKLEILPLTKPLIPLNLSQMKDEMTVLLGEDLGKPDDSKSEVTPEERFKELRTFNTPGNPFEWGVSDWGMLCPVSMKEGNYTRGSSRFATQFMNKIFFLHDDEAFYKFYKNPRPYLLPPFPKSSCRLCVFGAKLTGKTEISKCFAYLLNGIVLSQSNMKRRYMLTHLEDERERLRQMALAEGMRILDEKRQEALEERNAILKKQLEKWHEALNDTLLPFIKLLEKMEADRKALELSPFPMQYKPDEGESGALLAEMRTKVAQLQIPEHEEVDFYIKIVNDENMKLKYTPSHLKRPGVAKPATVTDKFVIAYADRFMSRFNMNDFEISQEDVQTMFTSSIREAEEFNVSQGGNKGGWIIDDMPADLELLEGIAEEYVPDDVLIMNPSSYMSVDEFKKRHSRVFRQYRDLFLETGRIDAAWRCPEEETIPIEYVVQDMVHGLIDNLSEEPEEDIYMYEDYKAVIDEYKPVIEKLREYFLSKNIHPIEIDSTAKPMRDVLSEAMERFENKSKPAPKILTEEERAEEKKMFMDQFGETGEGEGGGGSFNDIQNEIFQKNRRYGNTSFYCPVSFKENNVLWRGKEEFAVKFIGKIYLMSCQKDMDKFMYKPRFYTTFGTHITSYPPLRVCIVGLDWITNSLANSYITSNLGLIPVNYTVCLKKVFELSEDAELLHFIRQSSNVDHPISKYLTLNEPLDHEGIKNILDKCWHQFPFTECGFVLESFPRRTCDVEMMIEHKFIPDVVLCVTGDEDKLRERFRQIYIEMYTMKYTKMCTDIEEYNKEVLDAWRAARDFRLIELNETKKEERYLSKLEDDDAKSQVSYDSVGEQEDLLEIEAILDEEFPEPELQRVPESYTNLIQDIENIYVEDFNLELTNLLNIKRMCQEENIPWIDIQMDFGKQEKTKMAILRAGNKLGTSRKCIFDRVYDVSMETADKLLRCGYVFLSKFGKTCPVQYYKGVNPIQMYYVGKTYGNLFPVIHRNYVYFLYKEQSVELFKENPLLYINNDFNSPLTPYRVSIIGPVKCGKTTLSERLTNNFCFKYVTRGRSIRYVLETMPYCELAKSMERLLRKGEELTDEMVMQSVAALCISKKSVSQGMVFDGFPNYIKEVEQLAYLGIVPHLILDLQASEVKIMECLHSETSVAPLYSDRFIMRICRECSKFTQDFRDWLDREYQNRAKLSTHNLWRLWQDAYALVTAVTSEIKHYYKHANDDWPLRVSNMLVTPIEFLERQSKYKDYCPVCISRNELCTSGFPPDRTGLVQYKSHYYWLCQKDIETFLKCPECFFAPYNPYRLPVDLPERIAIMEVPDNVFSKGNCVVCPGMVHGCIILAVSYKDRVYLFDKVECMEQFMRKPFDFGFKEKVKEDQGFPALNYEDLPVLGMLEQYVAKDLVKAVCHLTKLRPVVPGLSIQQSAAICMGVFLKYELGLDSDACKQLCLPGYTKFYDRVKKLERNVKKLKTIINPYLYYDEILPKYESPVSSVTVTSSSSSITTIVGDILNQIVSDLKSEVNDDQYSRSEF